MRIQRYLDRVCLQLRLSEAETASIREELEAHLRERARDYRLKGFSEEESQERAVTEFGAAEEVGNRIMRSTVCDRWALLRSRSAEAGLVLFLPAAVALVNYFKPFFGYGFSEPAWPIQIWFVLLYGAAALGTVALYLPVWGECLRRGDRARFNWCALLYLLPAVYLAAMPLFYWGFSADAAWVLYRHVWLFASLLLITPLFGIFLGIAIGESVRFVPAPGGVPAAGNSQPSSLHCAAGYLAGLLLFGLCLYLYARYAGRAVHLASTFTGEIILTTLWQLVVLVAAVALGLPRLTGLRGRYVVFDRTRFAFFAVPGLFILTSYALYFFLPFPAAKEAISILFAYFDLHKWTVTGAVLLGLGFWMSLRVPGEHP